MSTNKERLIAALQEPLETTLTRYKTHLDGLKEDQVEENRNLYGENVITKGQEDSIIKKIYESIINPFTVILLVIDWDFLLTAISKYCCCIDNHARQIASSLVTTKFLNETDTARYQN